MRQKSQQSREGGAVRRGWAATCAVAVMTAISAIGPVLSQSTTSPTPTPPAPAPIQTSPGELPAPKATVDPRLIIGRWVHTRQDAETRASDNVVIEFFTDGRYQAQNRHSLLATPEKPAQGRYSLANLNATGFDLRIERRLDDPESDPLDAVEVQRITVVDSNTLLAADGSVVRRVKE